MRILAIGDIVGEGGRRTVRENLQALKKEHHIDFCIVNGENSVTGSGLTTSSSGIIFEAGADVITLGNHAFAKSDVEKVFESNNHVIRPLNYDGELPGYGFVKLNVKNSVVMVVNLLGRLYLENVDCPFKAIDRLLAKENADIVIVDFHAEATSEKLAMGFYIDGRVSAVFGTHTHVQTADDMILPKGTGYITDVGMTGPYLSVLGLKKEIAIARFVHHKKDRFAWDEGVCQINGIVFDIDESTKKTTSIERINIKLA